MTRKMLSVWLSELGAVDSLLSRMVEAGRIDLTILQPLAKLQEFSSQKEVFWKNNKSVSARSAFTLYHGWRNLRLTTSRMRARFIEAERRHENPSTAIEGSRVVPNLVDVYAILSQAEGKELSGDQAGEILDRVTELRNVAYHAGMLPSIREELAEADGKVFLRELEKFVAGIEAVSSTS